MHIFMLSVSPGSSPRVRGACKGLTQSQLAESDHPRVCGEHRFPPIVTLLSPGSSPRVRGASARGRAGEPRQGIIPACAGSMPSRCDALALARDHPRVCGEHDGVWRRSHVVMGSSPRVRGAFTDIPDESPRAGIIPACAGSIAYGDAEHASSRDHPRVCGEHRQDPSAASLLQGSSPRVRGASNMFCNICFPKRIIPACAGSIQNIT